jgi:hypothetical protein
MSIYVPNSGEKEALKAILQQQALIVGLYGTAIIPDGSTVFGTLTELTAGGAGYGYAPVPLSNDVLESPTPTAAKWTIITNAAGKAEAVYGAAPLSWTFLAPDVVLLPTVYGVYYATLVLPFTAGVFPIQVGDVLRQGAVCAEVTQVNVTSGSFALGTAAGNIYLKRQSGVFVAGATLIGVSNPTLATRIKVLAAAPAIAGAGYAVGDLFSIGTGTGGVGRVTSIGVAGAVTGVELLAGGSGYAVAAPATSKISGAGNDAMTVTVTSLYATEAPTLTVATIAGDSNKVLVAVESLTTAIPIIQLGQVISLTPKFSMSTG